ncbi:MAG: phosphate acyltransferase PlsX [candidate division WOR-3 bacterium]
MNQEGVDKKVKVALDAMGSDLAPEPEVNGTLRALEEDGNLEVILVGKEELLKRFSQTYPKIKIYPAEERIEMDESPTEALRKKPNSSLAKSLSLLKTGEADAVVSAGNTGALIAYSLTILGRIPGVLRPAVAILIPQVSGYSLLTDVGAHPDPKPIHLYQFAKMASTVAAYLFHKPNPRVGLLNVGREENKGSELIQKTYQLLKGSELNFIGNIEGCDVFKGLADVIVCDGFVGNIILKFGEGLLEILTKGIKDYLSSETKYRMRRWLAKPVLQEFVSRLDYEEQGGGLLLGVNGVVVISHGRSGPKAIKNALHTASLFYREKVIENLRNSFAQEKSLTTEE